MAIFWWLPLDTQDIIYVRSSISSRCDVFYQEIILTHSSNSSCLIINVNKMSSIISRNHINTLPRIMIFMKLKTFPTDKSSIKVSSCPKRREAFSETRWKGKNENDDGDGDCDDYDDDYDYSDNLDYGGNNNAQREIYFRRRFHK